MKEEIIRKFRELFLGEKNKIIAKNFLYMERRRIGIKKEEKDFKNPKSRKNRHELVSKIMGRKGNNYLNLEDPFCYNRNPAEQIFYMDTRLDVYQETQEFERILLNYFGSNEMDINNIISSIQNLFNNYIKIFNDPKKYEAKSSANGFIYFNWDDEVEMKAMVDGAIRIKEFSEFLKTKGINIQIVQINIDESNPIVKAANNYKGKENGIEVTVTSTESSKHVKKPSIDEKIMQIVQEYNTEKEKARKKNSTRTSIDEIYEAAEKYTKPIDRKDEIYTKIARILANDDNFCLSNITPQQLYTIITNYHKLEEARDEFLIHLAKEFCMDEYKAKRDRGEYSNIDEALLRDTDSLIQKEKKFDGLGSSHRALIRRSLGRSN